MLKVGDDVAQYASIRWQQRAQIPVQIALGAGEWRRRVKAHDGVQATIHQQRTPSRFAAGRIADEIKHRQNRSGAGVQQFDFIAKLGQHRLARIDHQKRGVDLQQRAQYLGLLFKDAVGLRAIEKAADPVLATGGAVDRLQVDQ